MSYRETCILLPCHSLEDFPLHYQGEEADGLLAAWTALWHPALLAATGAVPTWRRGDSPPGDLSNMLILVPGVSQGELPTGFAARAEQEGAWLIQGNLAREELLRQALAPMAELVERLDPELVADFLALGYGYLQIELLTRQMRYSTNLDEYHFNKQAVAGAKAVVDGDVQLAREQITACFDLLAQERDHYYAVDAYVLDVTLLSPGTLGAELVRQLRDEVPVNLLLTADLVSQIERQHPESFKALQHGLDSGKVGLIGGDRIEERVPLHDGETVLERLRAGLASFQEQLGHRPRVYGRRRYGLSVLHPQLLASLGYLGVLHAALGEGRYPEGSQLKMRWEGPGHHAIDAIARVPLDAAQAATFLSLASKLGETMDMDHVATVCMAHWPGRVCTWYDDLRRVARYGPLLGKFVTVDEYFRDTDYPGQSEQFKADQYRSPYLPQAVAQGQTDPISSSVRYWCRRTQATALSAMETMLAAIGRAGDGHAEPLLEEIDAHADQIMHGDIDHRLQQATTAAMQQLSGLVSRGDGAPQAGYLVLNPLSHVHRATLDLPGLAALPAVAKPVYAAAELDEHKHVVVDVPPMGFAWVAPGATSRAARRPPRLLAEEHRLFNEYFEANVNPTTGALQSIYEYERRGNRLSQQLAVRGWREQKAGNRRHDPYSVMAADQVEVTAASTALGEITSRGRLLSRKGDVLARFEQRVRVWRGSRVLQLECQLEPLAELEDDPWNSYYGIRLAWANEGAFLWRGVHGMRERAEAKRLEAPTYIDLDDDGRHTTLLTGGLPFHRRTDARMLDTLLIVQGETNRQFRLGIGIGLPYPQQAALAQMLPDSVLPLTAPPPSGPASGWLFHVDSRNVIATAWSPLRQDGIVTGVRVRLLETEGRKARTKVRACRSLQAAKRWTFEGECKGNCPLEDDAAVVEMGPNEWLEITLDWSRSPESPNGEVS